MSSAFAAAADHFLRWTDWPARVARELPLVRRIARETGARRLLETACGPAAHGIALAAEGFAVLASDLDPAMCAAARAAATDAGVALDVRPASLTRLTADLADAAPFDLALCLGNSIATLPERADAARALAELRAVTAPAGRALVHLVDLSLLGGNPARFGPVRAEPAPDGELLLLKYFAFDGPRPAVSFLELHRGPRGVTVQAESASELLDLTPGDLESLARNAGWTIAARFAGVTEAPYEPGRSPSVTLLLAAP